VQDVVDCEKALSVIERNVPTSPPRIYGLATHTKKPTDSIIRQTRQFGNLLQGGQVLRLWVCDWLIICT